LAHFNVGTLSKRAPGGIVRWSTALQVERSRVHFSVVSLG
jgi:hypothetical protein